MVTGQGPVTITDVARLAGVSPGTASKALNGRGGISVPTALRVREAAERLGYQPKRPGPRPADRPEFHRRADHHGQLRPVQHPGGAGGRGCSRPGPHPGLPV